MGFAKNQQIEHEAKRHLAFELAIEAGVLERCPYHEECTFVGEQDIEAAYKVANSKWSSGAITGAFASRREMTDCIKEVVDEHGLDECPRCRKNADE